MIEIIVALILYFIIDRLSKDHPADDNNGLILFDSSPNDTKEELREKKEMEEFIIYDDIFNNK